MMIIEPNVQPSAVATIHHQAFWNRRCKINHCRMPKAIPMTTKARFGNRNLPKIHPMEVAISHWNHKLQSMERLFLSDILW
jgi:hypothetical protein